MNKKILTITLTTIIIGALTLTNYTLCNGKIGHALHSFYDSHSTITNTTKTDIAKSNLTPSKTKTITKTTEILPRTSTPIIDNKLILEILKSKPNLFDNILKNANKYELQILYTQINRKKDGTIEFVPHGYNIDSNKYFYPASSVKLSACILALEKINNINIKGLNKYTPLKILSEHKGQTSENTDTTSENNLPSIAHYIKKILLESNNDAFSRLYEFLGQEYYNETLWKKGYKDCVILHRLSEGFNVEDNRYTNPFVFYTGNKVLYKQALAYNKKSFKSNIPYKNTQKGIGYIENGSFINKPKDFSKCNYMSIETLQKLNKAIMFPESIPENERFNLTNDDYEFLRKYMSMLPKESTSPKYTDLPDNYVKYFMYGDGKTPMNKNIKIFNKIGSSYGYLIDNAYIKDYSSNIEFLLTAVIYCDNDRIFNDENYDYCDIGFPFLSNLGNIIYEYERNGRCIITNKKTHTSS